MSGDGYSHPDFVMSPSVNSTAMASASEKAAWQSDAAAPRERSPLRAARRGPPRRNPERLRVRKSTPNYRGNARRDLTLRGAEISAVGRRFWRSWPTSTRWPIRQTPAASRAGSFSWRAPPRSPGGPPRRRHTRCCMWCSYAFEVACVAYLDSSRIVVLRRVRDGMTPRSGASRAGVVPAGFGLREVREPVIETGA